MRGRTATNSVHRLSSSRATSSAATSRYVQETLVPEKDILFANTDRAAPFSAVTSFSFLPDSSTGSGERDEVERSLRSAKHQKENADLLKSRYGSDKNMSKI